VVFSFEWIIQDSRSDLNPDLLWSTDTARDVSA